ncbi:MAG: flagellar basal body L-ring protein FlgH [Spirochaetales bacterium]|nr:flagellar basal body L-ring protein FlgH [Spirochaetales bacterium]
MKEKNQKIILFFTFTVFLFFMSFPVICDSLWDDAFDGYLSQSYPYKAGETLLVIIDSDYKFSLSSSSKDNKLLNLEFKGGGYGDLFSFLPAVKSSGSGTMGHEEEITLSTFLPVEILSIDENKVAQIRGQRSLSVDGREEAVSLSGFVFLKDVDKDRSVTIERVGNARLNFSSLLMPALQTISDADLQEVAFEVLGTPEMEDETAGVAAAEPALIENPDERAPVDAQATASPKPEFQLDEDRKKELFLIYVNRLVDVLFSQVP